MSLRAIAKQSVDVVVGKKTGGPKVLRKLLTPLFFYPPTRQGSFAGLLGQEGEKVYVAVSRIQCMEETVDIV